MIHLSSSSAATGAVALIGGGNMARSLISGWVAHGITPSNIHVAEPLGELRETLTRDFGVSTHTDALDAVQNADLWLFAVKPQVMHRVCETLAQEAQHRRPLAVSIAAGVTAAQIEHWLGDRIAVIRCMPNTPALLGTGVTGLYANDIANNTQRDSADRLLAAVGITVWIENETLMDAVTAVSGSGPAYAFFLAEAMEAAAIAEGLPATEARALVLHTLFGAARMLLESGESPAELRRKVTSPGGTTQAAIEALKTGGFEALINRAIHAARERGRTLAALND
ncbi:MAG: pyrroline-5-carboxylate reductase [Xanthomonadaceae bacterium]|jgi:pyrroline-5-carboxylate reductase|nr:pyrroline-5-carboxylate reductase [Xanthomonadaceae bacterium]